MSCCNFSEIFLDELIIKYSLGLVFALWVFPKALPKFFCVKCDDNVCCSFLFPLLEFPDLSHSSVSTHKVHLQLKSLLEFEICMLAKCLTKVTSEFIFFF